MNPHFFTAPCRIVISSEVEKSSLQTEVRRFASIFIKGDARKWRDPFGRPVKRGRGKGEKGSTKVLFE